jgi:prepilin peptidase CpaA
MRWQQIAIAFDLDGTAKTFCLMIARSATDMMFAVAFGILMVAAAWLDIRYRRIPNVLSLFVLAIGCAFAVASMPPREAAMTVLEGAATGLVVWLPFWALGMLGAGDVKFFAAAAAWLGPRLALYAALLSALLGAVLAVGCLVARAYRYEPGSSVALNRVDTIPYGVAMAAGLAINAWFPHLFH